MIVNSQKKRFPQEEVATGSRIPNHNHSRNVGIKINCEFSVESRNKQELDDSIDHIFQFGYNIWKLYLGTASIDTK